MLMGTLCNRRLVTLQGFPAIDLYAFLTCKRICKFIKALVTTC